MSDYPTLAEIQSKAAAERYALALSTAAAAQERITALEEALKDAEWLRLQAENLAMTVTYPEEFGRVWHAATEPPPDDITALIDLSTGTAWERCRNPTTWRRLGTHPYSTRYEWPIEDAGPFIALPESYGIRELGKTLDLVVSDHDEIHRQISGRPGYAPEGERYWTRPTLHEATGRVLAELDRAVARSNSLLWELVQDFQAIASHENDPTLAEAWRKASDLARDAYSSKTEG